MVVLLRLEMGVTQGYDVCTCTYLALTVKVKKNSNQLKDCLLFL